VFFCACVARTPVTYRTTTACGPAFGSEIIQAVTSKPHRKGLRATRKTSVERYGTPATSSERPYWLAVVGIALLTILTFAPVRGFEFVNYDDFEFTVENPRVAGGLTLENVRWAWQNPYSATGGPLTWMAHMLDVELFGVTPAGPHVVNLALHLASVLMLFTILRQLTGSTWRSAFVAALFGVHPLHVESVAWVAERKDVLSGVFWFAALGAYGWYVRRPGVGRYAAVAGFLILGLLSKPMVATLPFVLLLLDAWPLQRIALTRAGLERAPRLVAEKLPLIALAAVAMWLTLVAQEEIGAVSSATVVPIGTRAANAVVSYVEYLHKTVWPAELVPYYPYRRAIPALTLAGCAAVLIGLTVAAVFLARRAPFITIGWLWYVGMLIPVIGLVQVGGHAMADRFTYLPLIGIFIAIAWGIPQLLRPLDAKRRMLPAAAVVVIVALAATARAQSLHWRDGLALWEHTVRVDPLNARAHSNLGVVLAQQKRYEEAIRAYETALRLQPGVPQTHHNLGLVLEAIGRNDDASGQYAEAVRVKPDYAKAHMHLANLLAQRGSIEQAIQHYREAIRLAPEEPLTHVNLAVTFGRSGRPAEGVPHMREAIRLEPRNAQWRFFAGLMLSESGKIAEARVMFEEALAIDPNHTQAREALASVLSR
jgi:Flp pilus assembly protein TadD